MNGFSLALNEFDHAVSRRMKLLGRRYGDPLGKRGFRSEKGGIGPCRCMPMHHLGFSHAKRLGYAFMFNVKGGQLVRAAL